MKKIIPIIAFFFLLCSCAKTQYVSIQSSIPILINSEYEIFYDGANYYHIEDGTLVKNNKVLYLTFDDGPSKYTKNLLDLLNQYHIQATFFVVGENVKRYPKIIDQMIEAGHVIGNHSYTHINFKTHSISEINNEIQKSEDLLKKHNYNTYLLRPPYGALNPKLQTSHTIILWDNDSLDWKLKEKNAIIKQVTKHVKENQIILFHDLYPTTIETMEELIPLLLSKGYFFQPIREKK